MTQKTTPDTSPSDAPLVALEDVAMVYREGDQHHEVLHNISLHLCRGEIVVLMGKSGSGKSTLLNLISGIDTPTAGDIRLAGRSLAGMSEAERTLFRRQHIGFVFQFFNLVPTLTVLENVLLPLELNGQRGKPPRDAATAMLAEVGLGDRGGSFPDKLSGGEQQRVAIARALIHDPLLILADEPTGNLDGETSSTVLALLERLTRQAGKTMLMVTHSPDVMALADRVYWLRNGHLTTDAPAGVSAGA